MYSPQLEPTCADSLYCLVTVVSYCVQSLTYAMSQKESISPEEIELRQLLATSSNSTCADCGAKFPRFASITLAIFLCNRCYGIHRAIGAHITRTKCVGLDKWTPQEVHRMRTIGNAIASSYWECK